MGNWHDLAACLKLETTDFWNDDALADRTCRRCLVKRDCYQYAKESRIEWGVWGGMRWEQGVPKLLKPQKKRRVMKIIIS